MFASDCLFPPLPPMSFDGSEEMSMVENESDFLL